MLVESRGAGTRGRGECRGSPSATLRTTNGQLFLLDFLSTMALASRPDKTVPAWLIVTWAWAGGRTMNQRGIRKGSFAHRGPRSSLHWGACLEHRVAVPRTSTT